MPAKYQNTNNSDPTSKYKTEMKKVLTLTNKAIVSTSLKEKNDILLNLQEIFTPLYDSFEKHQTILRIKNDELSGLRKKLSEAQNQKDTLQHNTAFYSHAEKARNKHNENRLIDSIKDLEEQITERNQLAHPNKLSESLELPENSDQRLFSLIDLNLQRIEELAYSYKKRLIVVEESQESTEVVLRDYGSINHLLAKVQELEEENDKLKQDEKIFIHDAITKRRKFAKMTPISARDMITVFKNFIKADKSTIDSYFEEDFSVDLTDSNIDFDSVSADDGFKELPSHFESTDFGNTTEPEMIVPIIENDDLNEKINAFKNVISSVEATDSKILNEIASIPNHYDNRKYATVSHIDKIAEANEKILTKIRNLSIDLDSKNNDVIEISKQIIEMTTNRKNLMQFYVHGLGHLKRLTESHIDVIQRQTLNRKILTLLFQLTSSFGIYIFRNPLKKKKKVVKHKRGRNTNEGKNAQNQQPIESQPSTETAKLATETEAKDETKDKQEKEDDQTTTENETESNQKATENEVENSIENDQRQTASISNNNSTNDAKQDESQIDNAEAESPTDTGNNSELDASNVELNQESISVKLPPINNSGKMSATTSPHTSTVTIGRLPPISPSHKLISNSGRSSALSSTKSLKAKLPILVPGRNSARTPMKRIGSNLAVSSTRSLQLKNLYSSDKKVSIKDEKADDSCTNDNDDNKLNEGDDNLSNNKLNEDDDQMNDTRPSLNPNPYKDDEITLYLKDVYNSLVQRIKEENELRSEEMKNRNLEEEKAAQAESHSRSERVTADEFHERLLAMKKKKAKHAAKQAGSALNTNSNTTSKINVSSTLESGRESSRHHVTTSNNNNNNNNSNDQQASNDGAINSSTTAPLSPSVDTNSPPLATVKSQQLPPASSGSVLFLRRPRMEVLHGLSIAAELAGFTYDVDKAFMKKISKLSLESLRDMKESMTERLDMFGRPFNESIAQINLSANRILVKQKEGVAMQTDVQPLAEEETQTVQNIAAKPKPGKKK